VWARLSRVYATRLKSRDDVWLLDYGGVDDARRGIVLVHAGEGEGKSSSAFGVVFRAAGWGMKVCMIQFIKGQWKTGEQKAA